jgi:hypothetical protein
MTMLDYRRPEMGKEDGERANQMTTLLLRKSSKELRLGIALLILENMQLVKEVNEHRQELGFKALRTF